MRTRGKAEVRLAPPLPDDHVFGLGLPDRHRVMKDVWHAQQQIVKLAFHRLRDSKLALAGIGHLAQTFLECLVARPGELLGELVLLLLDFFGRGEVFAPRSVQPQDLVDGRRFGLELGGAPDDIWVLADEGQRQHQLSAFMTGNRITSRTDG